MSEEESTQIGKHTFHRINEQGLIETVCEDTGVIVAIQESSRNLSVPSSESFLTYKLEDGREVLVQKGLSLDRINQHEDIIYSEVLADIICQKIAEGETYTKLCAQDNMPNYSTLCKWRQKHPDFAERLEMARRDRADMFHDKVLSTAESTGSKDEAAINRVKLDAYRWAAERGNPDQYGNRTKISGDKSAPLQLIVDTGVPNRDDDTSREVGPLQVESKDDKGE